MRLILFLFFLIFINAVQARTYYFSDLSGNDSRSWLQAQSPSTPWKTLDKLNAFFKNLEPGDSVLFKRGETFYGSIVVSTSGTINRPIVIAAYGAGNKPVITGLKTLSNWSSAGNGKYSSYSPFLGNIINIVTVNGQEQPMGRYPNSSAANGGYLTFESHGANSITDKQLPASPGWKGAELVVRTNRFVLDRTKILSHSGTRLSYSPSLSYTPTDGFGYFIQNDIKTLDEPGEWYYNPDTRKMNMYFGNRPASAYSVKASDVNTLVYVYNKDNIVFDNLTLTGGNYFGFYVYSTDNVVIKNCDVSLSGVDAINVSNTKDLKIENNTIANTNNIAINLGNCYKSAIRNNEIKNTGLLQGLGLNSTNKTVAIRETGQYNTIEYNHIDSTGSTAIRFEGDHCLIKNNFINHFNLTKDDGGGIYTSSSYGLAHHGMKVIGNIVLNGTGAAAGTTYRIAASTTGIYMDDYAANVEVSGNTVAFCSRSGAFVHNAQQISLTKNTFYNSPTQLVLTHDVAAVKSPLRNNVIKNNILFSKKPSETVFAVNSINDDVRQAGVIDSNYYCRPLDDDFVIKSSYINGKGARITQNLELKNWQKLYKKDMSSRRTAIQIVPFRLKNRTGSNMFSNGGFNSSIRGANIYSTAQKHTTSWVPDKLDKGTLQGKISSSSPCIYTVSMPLGAVKPGKNYIATFSVQSSKDTVINVFVRQSASPFDILSNAGIKNVVNIGPGRKDYQLSFSPQIAESNSILVFESNAQQQTIWLDNVNIYQADMQVTNPDDSIRFEYNATQLNKSVALPGTYVDARGTEYKNKIVLAPYTSAILIKKNITEASVPTVEITSPAVNAKYRALATVTITATAKDADGKISKVAFYNGATLLGTTTTSPYTWSWKNVPAGNYTLTAQATGSSGKTATSKAVAISVNGSAYPTVKIISPAVSAKYTSPAAINLAALATDADGKIKKVQFYSGTTLLHTEFIDPYTFAWKNVPAGNYTITARAVDDDGNIATSSAVKVTVARSTRPIVKIIGPVINSKYSSPATINISASASDGDGKIKKVEFYNGADLIHTEFSDPYTFSWKNVSAGNYTLSARAVDDDGNITSSAGVPVQVVAPAPPAVKITSPAVNSKYTASATITLSATASDADGNITKVEFYNGTTLLATEKLTPYSWSWKNVPAGNYKLTARATDNSGNVTVSSSVSVAVTSSSLNMAPPGSPELLSVAANNAAVADNVLKSLNFKLYPNPAIDKIQIYFDEIQNSGKANIAIIDLLGKTLKNIPVLLSGRKTEVDISFLNPGTYFLRFSSDNGIVNKKFIKGN